MEVKKKGRRVHPSSPSSSPLSSYKDRNSVFKLFPMAILALASTLPPQDQEVLAYMITRSIILTHQPKNKCKKGNNKAPLFQCGCFECYTRFWHRWDSSPNRDLIHQVIEAFEDHLVQNEATPKKQCKASRKKEKVIMVNNICEPNESEGLVETESKGNDEVAEGKLEMEVAAAVAGGGGGVSHKGLARKVLPDVVGLFNSRFWSLWGTSI
ncbi:hypothetical protein CXB51_018422 [Gossypium anomalum]|uniref:Uncharacterized protein n=2 Tax=Gossypium TaxID=3633 RepID=A0A8J5YLR5_9ROSI|nr:hypothetical protein CXB51_018422 [Gossypium anomalum]